MQAEFIYVAVIGLGVGYVLRYLLPGRETYGIFLLPAVGAVVAAALWAILTWSGLKADGTWIWVAAIGGAAVVSAVVAVIVRSSRTRIDRQRLHELSGGHAA
jgi:uncharacterized membrane protein YeaQ/YmgE (transglycosylase-associated protein family)